MKLALICVLLLVCLTATTQAQKRKHGFIILHELGNWLGDTFCGIMKRGLRVNEAEVRVQCTESPCVKHTLIDELFPKAICLESWFDFEKMPAAAVLSSGFPANREELAAAGQRVEAIIQDMVNEGIPSENIVVTGASQGGALTLYTAVHSKFKLGAFVPFVAWYPNLKSDGPANYDPLNKNTPILQINGMADFIVPMLPAARRTRKEMAKVFPNYDIKYIPLTTHVTTAVNPVTWSMMRKFLEKHDLLSFCNNALCI